MDWCRLGTSYYLDAAVLRAGEAAEVLFLRCIAYCGAKESKGRIDKAVLPMLAPLKTQSRLAALIREGLLVDEGQAVLIRSWEHWQEALDVEAERRRRDRDRKREERTQRRQEGHEVYRLYRADEVLLYVGQTWDLLQRMRDHSITKWWQDVSYCTLEAAATTEDAIEIERRAIELEEPLRNISRGNLSPAGWQSKSEDVGRDRGSPVQGFPSRKEVEVEKDKTSALADPPRTDVEGLCKYFLEAIGRNGVKATITEKWRTEARLLLDRDKRDRQEIRSVIDWCVSDEFWKANVHSVPTLRAKYDRLRLAMQRERPSAEGNPATAWAREQG